MASSPRPAVATASKAEKDADVVMGTNNSSIASKRSVEMIYYPQPHFFRYFVKKPQRRSPTINRGYWLRMHIMAETVRQFMEAPADKPKFILNLGCGYDSLPFSLLSDELKSMRRGHTIFVDVDYEKLMVHKKNAIRQTPEIKKVIGDVEFGSDVDAIQIRSPQYLGVGCDLKNTKKLDDVLQNSILPSKDCSVLCLAEVSLTYMDVKSANDVVTWASTLTNDVQFCILEQFFPDGPEHPFAKTMMSSYQKMRAPLFSINEFPSLEDQEQRFKKAGWASAQARSLWDLWSDSALLSKAVRTGLDKIEAFDEWEDFAIFASHYFLLIASNKLEAEGSIKTSISANGQSGSDASERYVLEAHCPPGKCGRRRYGTLVPGPKNNIGIHGGQGEQTRLATTDLYRHSEGSSEPQDTFPSRDVPARMCHTITPLSKGDCLLVGGRTSPTAPLDDCWLRQNQAWRQIHPLPNPRFRHNATDVVLNGNTSSILVYGGKSDKNTILDSWILWNEQDEQGWQAVVPAGPEPEARFGACFSRIDGNTGVLFGGIGRNGTILEDIWTWNLSHRGNGRLQVELTDVTRYVRDASPRLFSYLTRFGATANAIPQGLVIAGGIIPRQLVPADKEILLLDVKDLLQTPQTTRSPALISAVGLGTTFTGPRPLLTGHVACTIDSDQVLFLGGGAVCFPSGTFWSEGTWLLRPRDSKAENRWAITAPKEAPPQPTAGLTGSKTRGTARETAEPTPIPRVRIESAVQFQQILTSGMPVVLEESNIGPCTQRWTKEYLTSAVGQDRKVVVHEAQSEQMNFQSKNFAYVTKSFGAFLDEVHAGGRQYLRSISADQPSKLPASLASDFPTLQDDFRLPGYMAHVTDNVHSSPLRISGPVTMWLHYDPVQLRHHPDQVQVMANVLCQVRGERRLRLFPPDDVQSLHIPAGASSSTIDVFQSVGLDAAASIPGTSPQEAILRPGEILFIPPLWSHTACSATSEVSVAVNVFFRNLTKGYATGRDVYGNRDLQAYEKSRQDLQRVARSFDGVPPDMARFYLRRLAQELQELADQ